MNRWLTRSLGAVAIALVVATPAGAIAGTSTSGTSPAPQGDLPEKLQTRLREALDQTMATYNVPGAGVGVWVPGEGTWIGTAGLADLKTKAPVTKDMIWPLRSITKSFTVTLILQLADAGRLSLDDPIDKYVSGVTDGASITLRELASMSSGNAEYVGQEFLEDFQADPDKIFTLDELNSYVLGRPARFAPGTRRIYTNSNTNLLGVVVEKVTGKPFKDVLSERILEPLGLKNTHYLLDAAQWPKPHAIGYEPVDGVLTPTSRSTGPPARWCRPSTTCGYGPSRSPQGACSSQAHRVSGSKVLRWRRDRLTTVMRSASARPATGGATTGKASASPPRCSTITAPAPPWSCS